VNSGAATKTKTNYITVNMVADFSATPTTVNAGSLVIFTDQSLGSPTSWNWTFGDGGTSTLQNPTHTYTVAGVYTVVLSVNSGASTKTRTNYITVNMVADFTATPVVGVDSLTVSFTDISLGTPTSWSWDFGDNDTSTEQNPVHIYNSAGVYTVTLRAVRGSFEDTETKDELIKIGFIDSIQKLSYIRILPRLSTEDIAPPVSRPDLRIMYVNGVGNYSYPKKGIRAFIPSNTSVVSGSGFKRPQGPTLIFD
jgi:PKD repeat protein